MEPGEPGSATPATQKAAASNHSVLFFLTTNCLTSCFKQILGNQAVKQLNIV